MQENNELSPADRELAESLRVLKPVVVRIDPVAAAFAAGRRSATRQLQRWRAAVAVLVVVSAAPWLTPAVETGDVSQRLPSTIASRAPAPTVGTPPPVHSVMALRQAVFRNGIEALPPTQLLTSSAVRAIDLL
jgi:hypothetical protein